MERSSVACNATAGHLDHPDRRPGGGYLALSLFGVAPIAGVGDDTITNFNVPTFYYGGEAYTRIGVVSNGYLVLGGGNSGDIVFTPQHFPNANGRTTCSHSGGRTSTRPLEAPSGSPR